MRSLKGHPDASFHFDTANLAAAAADMGHKWELRGGLTLPLSAQIDTGCVLQLSPCKGWPTPQQALGGNVGAALAKPLPDGIGSLYGDLLAHDGTGQGGEAIAA